MNNVELLRMVPDWTVSRWAVSYAVNALWQAPMIGAAAWVVARMVRRAGPRAEHRLWVAALLLLVVLPAVPRRHWQMHEPTATVSMGVSDIDVADLPPLEPVAPPLWDQALGMATLPRGLVLALLLGYVGVGLYFAARLGWWLWRTRVLVHEAEEVEFSEDADAAWERCREAFALNEVQRLVSSNIACPVTVGRGTVLLPVGFLEDVGREEMLTAMAHECAHVRRRDFWKNVAYELASLPVAFHPVLWMVKRELAETREMVCDRAAVERVVAAGSYVRSLLRLAESVVGPPAVAVAMGMFDGRTLERRIISMRTRKAKLGWAARAAVAGVAAVTAAAVVGGATLMAVQVEAKAAPVEPVMVAQTPDSGVPAELPLLQEKLQAEKSGQAAGATPEARADVPAVTAEERARRMEYANKHFGYGSVAGENSDRGRMYIRYGRPTDVESHPSGGVASVGDGGEVTVKYAFEVWSYQYLAGVGDNLKMEFVDECQCGEYHAAAVAVPTAKHGAAGPLVASLQVPDGIFKKTELEKQQAQVSVTLQEKQKAFSAKQVAKTQEQVAETQEQLRAANSPVMARYIFRHNQPLPAAAQAGVYGAGVPAPAAGSAQGGDGPKRISGGVMTGMKLGGEDPLYPPIARAAHVQGTVVLHAIISATGAVQDLQVISGPQMLQNAAMEAVRTWQYKPYVQGDVATAVDTTITVNFSMGGDGGRPAGPVGPAAGGVFGSAGAAPQGASVQRTGPRPLQINGNVMAGSRLSGEEPAYPPIARAAHVQGSVVLHAIISKTGAVEDLQVVSGPNMLQNAALEAVRSWKYKPYLLGGVATDVETTITVNFTMTGDKPAAADAQANAERMRQLYEQGVVSRQTAEQAQMSAPQMALRKTYYAAPQGAQVEPGIYRIGGGVSAPRVTYSKEPEYTEDARKAKVVGTVLIGLVIDREGRPQNVHVMHRENGPELLGHGLEAKAVEAVKQYKFAPAMREGKPVAVEMSIEVDFQVF